MTAAIPNEVHHTHDGAGEAHGPMHSANVYPTATLNSPASHNPVTAMIAQITVAPSSSRGSPSIRAIPSHGSEVPPERRSGSLPTA